MMIKDTPVLKHHVESAWGGWLLAVLLLCCSAVCNAKLTEEQTQWLAAHQTIRFAPEADYGPFIFVDADKKLDGLSYDFLKSIEQRTGLKIQNLPAKSLSDHLSALRQGEVDLISSLRPTPERAEYLGFTRPYVVIPAVVVAKTGSGAGLGDLKGKRVGVGKGYAVEGFVRERYPSISWVALPDDVAALKALQAGDLEAAVMDSASALFNFKQLGMSGFDVGERTGFEYPLSFGYRKDWPMLGEILEAGLLEIPQEEQIALLKKWLPVDTTARDSRQWLALGIGAILLVLGAIGLLVKKSRSEQT